MKHFYFKICECCGAHLDPGERCDCRKETEERISSMEEKKFEFEITEHIAKLSENKRGGSLELNKTKFPGQPERYDLRRWYKDESGTKRMGRVSPSQIWNLRN